MMAFLGQVTDGAAIAIGAGFASSGLAVGLLISLIKHANNADIHIGTRDNFIVGKKEDFVSKETCNLLHAENTKLALEAAKLVGAHHIELKNEVKSVRKGLAYLLSLQTGGSLIGEVKLDERQKIVFDNLIADLNHEDTDS